MKFDEVAARTSSTAAQHSFETSFSLLSVIALSLAIVTLSACTPEDAVAPTLPHAATAVERGEQLVTGVAACGSCHSLDNTPQAPLSGGPTLQDKYGAITAPNITMSESGIGSWSEADLKRFLRTSVRPDGSQSSSAFHRGFEWMSDADIGRITVYLLTRPAVESEVERRDVSFLVRNTVGFFDTQPAVRGYVPEIPQSFTREYGKYTVDHVARCGACHSKAGGVFDSEKYLAGGAEVVIEGIAKVAPNISSSSTTGIGSWSEEALHKFLTSGQTPRGTTVDPRFCPISFYAHAPARDIKAIVTYIRSVPAID